MSETVRSFSGSDNAPRVRGRRARRGTVRNIVLAIVIAATLYSCYATRDSAPMERFIPANQAYHAFADDIQAKREAIASSTLWHILPPNLGGAKLAARIGQDVGMPDWILRNLVPSVVYVSGKDTAKWSDVLIVSRMTRIGCVLSKCRRFIPGIDEDYAGGLRMAYVKDAGLHFAVRGRTLLASMSRDALIRSLTLQPEDALKRNALSVKPKGDEGGDVQGTVTLAATDPLGEVLQGVSFALRIDKTRAQIKCRAVLTRAWDERLGSLFAGVKPFELVAPPEGAVQFSFNMGRPLGQFGAAVLATFDKQAEFDQYWSTWSKAAPLLTQVAAALLGPLGPGVRLSCQAMALDEMIPMPKLVLTIDAPKDAIIGTYASLPPVPSPIPGDMIPHYDPAKRLIDLSIIGGPSMEPTAGIAGSSLVLSNCRPVVENFLANPPKEDKLPQRGNVYVRIAPHATIEAVAGLAQLLAENHFLKGYSPEQVQQFFSSWLKDLAKIRDVTANLDIHNGEITLDLAATAEEGK
ncbi:MAG: hypothetical protein NTU83_00695 [Candidatus Hydrogenedentes bacterium]|nr:hypothetical protein [Candidatus Hydrogenedentota bacterium]